MNLNESAAAYYTLVGALSKRARKRALAIWNEIDSQGMVGSWDRIARDALLAEVSTAQRMAAISAARFMGAALTAQGADWLGEQVNPMALVGAASDGRDLDSLLFQPVVSTMRRLKDYVDVEESMRMGAAELDMIVGTQVTDAARSAMQVEMAAQPAVMGYVRMLNPPSCGRCAILAGRFYRFSDGFERHPLCLPAGAVVSGPATRAATRRWYEGELTVVRTASGKKLAVTGNHPVLTDRGWLPARLLLEGDNVVGRAGSDRAVGLLVPHENQVPTPIEDVWRAGRMSSLRRVPTAPEDFHGDGTYGQVDVVLANRLLHGDPLVALAQVLGQAPFSVGAQAPVALPYTGTNFKGAVANLRAASSIVSTLSLIKALGFRHLAGPQKPGSARVANLGPGILQTLANSPTSYPQPFGDGVLALAGQVGTSDGLGVEGKVPTRWDAPAVPFSMESGRAYADIGEDLRLRLASQVSLDRVVEVSGVQWSGHVYNLTSAEGWYSANGLIVSNCDCLHIPSAEDAADDLRTDPAAYFESLSEAEQNKYFGKGSAEAIRQGADMNQVVNARRKAAGLSRVGSIETTTEGTTRRGVAGRKLILAEGGDPTQRGAAPKAPRLTPDAILQVSKGDREKARQLFEKYGFIS